jgi:peptidoglycan/LPS O-acetylase OafA/YrhL
LLQGFLGYEGLSAGVWYIAIDFQLFALLVGILWLARALGHRNAAVAVAGALLVATLAVSSLFYFNRDGDWDNWGVYFFGAYALGIASYWTSTNQRRTLAWLLPVPALVIAALLLDYRPRIAVALLAALTLTLAARCRFLEYWPKSRLIAFLGQISYSVFLVHFPICLVINGLFARFASPDPWVNLTGMIIAWVASIAAGALFYRFVESPAQQGLLRTRSAPAVKQTL